MRNPNVASLDRFSNETLADELIRHFKKRHYARQERTKDLSKILSPLLRGVKQNVPKEKLPKYVATATRRPKKQVVIKNIGNLKLAHLKNSLNYVITNAKQSTLDSDLANSHLENAINYAGATAVSIIDENGNVIDDSKSILKAWADDCKNQKPNANLAWHLAFSIDEPITDENLAILQKAAKEALDMQFCGEYKYMIAIHAHQNKPHCHAIVNKTSKYTKYKLHFDSRNEIKDFFFDLREHFKFALCNHSKGKLLYDNSYAYERDSYTKKLNELESINLSDFASNKTFDFESYIDEILKDLRSRESVLIENKGNFERQIMNLKNEYKALAKSSNAVSLIDNPKFDELCKLALRKGFGYELVKKSLGKITKDIESIKLFNQTIRNNLSGMSLLKRKETLIKSLKKSRNISKDGINKILLLESEVNYLKKHQQENSISIISSFNSNIKRLNAKSNLFVLVPMQDNLIKYKNALESFEIADDSKKKELDSNKNRCEVLINNRLDFLLQSLQSALEKQDSIDEKYLKRFAKNMDFIIKEIGYGVNFLSAQDEVKFKNLCQTYRYNKKLAQSLIKESDLESNLESNIDSAPSKAESIKEKAQGKDINPNQNANSNDLELKQAKPSDKTIAKANIPKQNAKGNESNKESTQSRADIE